MTRVTSEANAEYLDQMKSSRKGAAVLKLELVALRSSIPNTAIFAVEGVGDKGVYFQWARAIRPRLDFEPFPCSGKKYVLKLKEIIDRDLNDLGKGVYFFVDRDFDDLQGHLPAPSIYMTDAYSIENYLVTPKVLDELLKVEFDCHAQPNRRAEVVKLFEHDYEQFLEITRDLNFRLFVARKLEIELAKELPKKVSALSKVAIGAMQPSDQQIDSLIPLDCDLDPTAVQGLEDQFSELDRKMRFRGKFAILFFMKWLELLAIDRSSNTPTHFGDIAVRCKVKHQTLTMELLASKSDHPERLADFINAI
jgi:hypothetical protein